MKHVDYLKFASNMDTLGIIDSSPYINIESLNTDIDNNKKSKYYAMHINIQSLPAKMDKLKNMLVDLSEKKINIDFLMLCETFLKDNSLHLYDIPGYTLVCKNKSDKTKGGGVAIYVKNTFNFEIRHDLSVFHEREFESLFIEINSKTHKAIIGEIYRVPNSNVNQSLGFYESIINKLSNYKHDIIIGTDQNFDLLKIDSHNKTSKLLDMFMTNRLLPCITKPTCITHSSATLIDNLYISMSQAKDINSGVLLYDISDHLPIFVTWGKQVVQKDTQTSITIRPMDRIKVARINDLIEAEDWGPLNEESTNEAYDLFNRKLQTILDKVTPEKTITQRSINMKRDPWMTKGLLTSSRKVQRLYKKQLKTSKNHIRHDHYIKYRNMFNQLKRKAKQIHYQNIFEQCKKDIRKTWQVLNSVIGKSNDKSNAAQMFMINGKYTEEPCEIANGFGKFFSQVGEECEKIIPKTSKSHVSYMQNKNRACMFMSPTDPQEIQQIITQLKNKNSSGIDKISSNLIKQLPSLTHPLSILINKSLQEGIMPDILKIAKVQPIYKAKEKQCINNYRPISILPTISKIFEKIVFKRTLFFLNQYNIIYNKQYGFRPKHSTIDAVIDLTQNIYDTFEKKEHGIGIFLDLSKAFDTINHDILLKKLEWYGVRGKALEWYTSYLCNRKLYTKYNNNESDFYDIKYGVPQGSILGPLLFILYINDLPNAVKHSSPILFADDTSLYLSHKSLKEVTLRANADLNQLQEWFQVNRMSLNISKTQYIHFTLNTKKTKYTNIEIAGMSIEENEVYKFLGIHIDALLNWNHHVSHIKSKINSATYALNRIKNYIPFNYMKTLYFTLVQSHMEYGLILYGNSNQSNMQKLQTAQNKAIRSISKSYNCNSMTSLYKDLRILKLKEQYEMTVGKYMFRFNNGTLPGVLQGMYQTNRDLHNYNTRNRDNPVNAIHRLDKTNKSVLNMGPKLWHNIPNHIKQAKTIKNFKHYLKHNLFQRYESR